MFSGISCTAHVVKVRTVSSLMIPTQNLQWSANIISSAAVHMAPDVGTLHLMVMCYVNNYASVLSVINFGKSCIAELGDLDVKHTGCLHLKYLTT